MSGSNSDSVNSRFVQLITNQFGSEPAGVVVMGDIVAETMVPLVVAFAVMASVVLVSLLVSVVADSVMAYMVIESVVTSVVVVFVTSV